MSKNFEDLITPDDRIKNIFFKKILNILRDWGSPPPSAEELYRNDEFYKLLNIYCKNNNIQKMDIIDYLELSLYDHKNLYRSKLYNDENFKNFINNLIIKFAEKNKS